MAKISNAPGFFSDPTLGGFNLGCGKGAPFLGRWLVCRDKKKNKNNKTVPVSILGCKMEEISTRLPKKYGSKAGFAPGIDPTAIKRRRKQERR